MMHSSFVSSQHRLQDKENKRIKKWYTLGSRLLDLTQWVHAFLKGKFEHTNSFKKKKNKRKKPNPYLSPSLELEHSFFPQRSLKKWPAMGSIIVDRTLKDLTCCSSPSWVYLTFWRSYRNICLHNLEILRFKYSFPLFNMQFLQFMIL